MCGTPVFVAVARMQGVPLAIALSIRSRISSVIVIIGMAHPFGECGAIAWVWPRQVNSESISHVVVRCAIEFIPLSFWYDAPLRSQDRDRRHDPWLVYGSPSCSPAR